MFLGQHCRSVSCPHDVGEPVGECYLRTVVLVLEWDEQVGVLAFSARDDCELRFDVCCLAELFLEFAEGFRYAAAEPADCFFECWLVESLGDSLFGELAQVGCVRVCY